MAAPVPQSLSVGGPRIVELSCGERLNAATLLRPTISTSASGEIPDTYYEHYRTAKTSAPRISYQECSTWDSRGHPPPADYVSFKEASKADLDDIVEYVVDEEDDAFIERINRDLKSNESKLTADHFERFVDRLEKECHFTPASSARKRQPSGTEDDVCCVCQSGEPENANQIIYCDMCNIAVHQECYGVPYIPEGPWLCRRCRLSPSRPVRCVLCPSRVGAFKQTPDGRWAHVVCAIWLNEVHFGNVVFLEPIEGVDASLHRRSRLRCLVCRNRHGACLQCSNRSCARSFHVTCAQNAGMSMEVVSDKTDGDRPDVQRYVYCHLHAADANVMDRKQLERAMKVAVRKAREKSSARSSSAPALAMPVVEAKRVASITRSIQLAEHLVQPVVAYWWLKRRSRFGVPLIRRLAVATSSTSRPPSSAAISTIALDNESQRQLLDMQKVRVSLEKARLLSELVKKRELHKASFVRINAQIFHRCMRSPLAIFQQTVDELCRKDKKKVFAAPVTLPGYRDVITQPMDLGTIREKAKHGHYKSMDELKADFMLMCRNCEKFNQGNRYYIKYGRRMLAHGVEIIDDAYRQLEWTHCEPDNAERATTSLLYEIDEPVVPEPATDTTTSHAKTSTPRITFAHNANPSSEEGGNEKSHLKRDATSRNMSSTRTSEPSSKRARTLKAAAAKTPPITKFFTDLGVRSWKAPSRTPVAPPFSAYRENSVVSPPSVPPTAAFGSADSATSEEDSPRRRRPIVEALVMMPKYVHGDVVLSGNGRAGRVLEHSMLAFDKSVPDEVFKHCTQKETNTRGSQYVFVLYFTRNNQSIDWQWESVQSLRMFDPDQRARSSEHPSLQLARHFVNRILGNGGD